MKYVSFVFLAAFLFLAGCSNGSVSIGKTETPSPEPVMISGDGIAAAEPVVARDASGAGFVVYVEHRQKEADVFLQKVDANGKRAGEKIRVNPNVGEAKAWKGDAPTIAITSEALYIGWTRKYTDPEAKGTELVLSASHDGGKTFAEPVKVNDDTKPASHGMHSLAVDTGGRLYLAWLDERNIKQQPHDMTKMGAAMHHEEVEPNSEVFYSVSTDGGKTFAANKKIATEVCPCCKTSLLAADDGTVYASWRQVLKGDHRHIAVASSTDAGATFSAGVVVSDDKWQLTACPVSGAALASSAPKTLDVVWYTAGEAGQAGVYFTRSTDAGKTFADRTLVSSEAGAGTPTLTQRDGKSVVVFASFDGGSITASWTGTPQDSIKIAKTTQAMVPTAAKGMIAFVRDNNGKPSVWLTIS